MDFGIVSADNLDLTAMPSWESLYPESRQLYYACAWMMTLKSQRRPPGLMEIYLRLVFFPWSLFWGKGDWWR